MIFRAGMLMLMVMIVWADRAPALADDNGLPHLATTTPAFVISNFEKSSNMSSNVALLASAVRNLPAGRASTPVNLYSQSDELNALSEGRILRMNQAGFVQVYVHLNEPVEPGTLNELRSFGAVIERQDESGLLVQTSIPAARIAEAADLEPVAYTSLCRATDG